MSFPKDEASRLLLEKLGEVAARTSRQEGGLMFGGGGGGGGHAMRMMSVVDFRLVLANVLEVRLDSDEAQLLSQWYGNGTTATIDINLFTQQFLALGE